MTDMPWVMLGTMVALALVTLLLLVLRTCIVRRGPVFSRGELPAGLVACRAPALLLEPAISGLLPVAYAQRTQRVLDCLGWYPQMTPALWVATRVLHAGLAASAALLVAGPHAWGLVVMACAIGFMSGGMWLRRLLQERERQISRELPAYLDLLTVCVEAGATLTSGARLIVAKAPATPLRGYFERVLREVRSGRPRAEAFVHVAGMHGVESLSTLANALAHAEAAGMSLGQILRTQSEQRTAERFARAEKLAMQAPVKMLGPLIFCIFPCTFIVLAVPIAVRMLEAFRS